MGGKAYRTLRPLLRVFPSFYRFRHRIRENNLERDRTIVAAALDRIEYERQNRAYLVGEAFTVADPDYTLPTLAPPAAPVAAEA